MRASAPTTERLLLAAPAGLCENWLDAAGKPAEQG